MAITLPPASSPLTITLTFGVQVAPYVTDAYTRLKVGNETIEQFYRRQIRTFAIGNRIDSEKAISEKALNDEERAVRSTT